MKKTLKRLRTLAALAVVCVLGASSAWADATLSYTGYLGKDSSNPTAVFSGIALTDIAHGKYVLGGNIGGGNVNIDGEAGVYNYTVTAVENVNSISDLTVQFQRIDDGYCKCVEVVFTEASGNVIKAYAKRAGYKAGASLGNTTFTWDGTVVTDATTAGYGVYDLTLVLVDRVPVAVWDGAKGDFTKATVNGVTFNKNGNDVPNNGAYVKISQANLGAVFKLDQAYAYVVGEFTVTNLNESTAANRVLAFWSPNETGTGNTVGIYLQSEGCTTRGIWANKAWGDGDASSRGTIKSGVTTDSSRRFVLTTEKTYKYSANDSKIGTHLFELTGDNPSTAIFGSSGNTGLRANQSYQTLAVGGLASTEGLTDAQKLSAMSDLVITRVVIYASNERQYTSGSSGIVDINSIENPTTETVSNGVSINASVLNAEAPVCVYMEDGATLNLDVALSSSVYLFGSVSGDSRGLVLNDHGTISCTGVSYLPSNITGSGTVSFPDKTLPSVTAWMKDSANWTGTVVLNNCGADVSGTSGHGYVNFEEYGNANSFIRAPGFKGYTKTTLDCQATLVIEDGETFTLTDGNGTTKPFFKKVKGSGTLALAKARSANTQYVIENLTEFTGTVSLASDNFTHSLVLGGTSSWTHNTTYNTKLVIAGNVTVKSGKTWISPNGMVVIGTLQVESGATVPTITTTDTAQYSLAGSATIGTVSGNRLASSLFITNEGATLTVSDTSIDELTIPADNIVNYYNLGSIDLSGCSSLTKVYLDLGASKAFDVSSISLPSGCAVYALMGSSRDFSAYAAAISGVTFLVDETKAEYGAGSLSVSNVPSGASVAVRRPDGTIVLATVDSSTATLTESVKIDGVATAYDITYTNSSVLAYKMSNATARPDSWTAADFNNTSADKSTGMLLYKTPWIADSGAYTLTTLPNFQSSMSLAVVGQMPSVKACATFIHLGGTGSAGFLIARSETDNEVIVAYNSGSTVRELTKMTVPNASTSRHAYVITKHDTASTTVFTIYLDGIKWKTVALDSVLTISGGVQVGSDFQGGFHGVTQADGRQYKSITSSATPSAGYVTDTTGYVNCIRLYDRILTQTEINEYSSADEYPYVSPNGSSSRTFAASAANWIDNTEDSQVWVNSGAENSGTPTAEASVTVNASVDTVLMVNLESQTSYEALTINGSAVKFSPASASSGAIKVTGMTVIGATVTNAYGAVDMTGGPMTITEDGDVTFDMSGYDASTVYSTTDVPLTSDVDQNDAKVHLIAPVTPYRTYSLVYTSSHYAMQVEPISNPSSKVYYTGGNWGDNTFALTNSTGSTTITFPGDTVVIPADLTGDNASAASFGASLPANVASISVEKNYTFNLDSTDAGDSLTINLATGTTLNLNGSLTAAEITFTGSGTVVCSAKNTLNGTVKGDATITIQYPEHIVPEDATWTDSAWAGTLVITNCGHMRNSEYSSNANYQEQGRVPFESLGNAHSKIKAPGFKGYAAVLDQNTICQAELIIDESTTFEFNHGWNVVGFYTEDQNAGFKFRKLSGDGKLRLDGNTDFAQYIFCDVSGFTGDVDITYPEGGGRKSYLFGVPSTWEIVGSAYPANLVVASSMTVAASKKWDIPAGIILRNDATLGLSDGSIITALSPKSDGGLSIPSGTATLSNVLSSVVSTTINIGSGAKLEISDASLTSITIPADSSENGTYVNNGVLDLTGCTSLTTIHFVLGESTSFADLGTAKLLLPATCKTYVYDIGSKRNLTGYTLPTVAEGYETYYYATETIQEYAAGGFTVSNVSSGDLWLIRQNGALIKTAADGTTRKYDGGRSFAGAACWHEWDFEQTETADKLKDSGACTTNGSTVVANNLSITSGSATYQPITVSGQESKTALPSYFLPYPSQALAFPTDTTGWSMALRCSMPTGEGKKVAIAFGDIDNGILGLASAPGGFVEMFNWVNGTYTTLAQLKVEVPADPQYNNMHLFVFTVTNGTITLYRDGEFIHTAAFSLKENGTITQFKVGDVCGTRPVENDNIPVAIIEANTGYVDYVRLYDRILPEADITGLSLRRPFVSSVETYERTINSFDAQWSASGAWSKKSDGTTVDAPVADTKVTLNSDDKASISLNLASDVKYNTLIFGGEGEISLLQASTGKIGTEMFVVRRGIDLIVDYNAVDLSDAVVGVDQGAMLTFDFTEFPFGSVTETTNIVLAGSVPAKAYDNTCGDRFAVTWPETLPAHIQSAVATWDGNSYKVTITPDHTAGGNVYYVGGVWSSGASSFVVTNAAGRTTAVLPGDTVVIPAYIDGENSVLATFGASLPANVTDIRVDKNYTFMSEVDAVILGGATITVSTGSTLTFGAVELGAVTLSGAVRFAESASAASIAGNAAITVETGKTLTLDTNDTTFAGSFAGNGTVKIQTVNSADGFKVGNYNGAGTIAIGGMSNWFKPTDDGDHVTITSAVRLDGDMTITALSQYYYSFAKLTGTHDLIIQNHTGVPHSFTIDNIQDYSGSINNNHASPQASVTVTKITLAEEVACGTKILNTNGVGRVTVSKAFVGNDEKTWAMAYAEGGVYRAAATYGGNAYATVAAAIDAANAASAALSGVIVLDPDAEIPPEYYYISVGTTVGKCAAALVSDSEAATNYYPTVQAAVDAANVRTSNDQAYDYVLVFENTDSVSTSRTLKVKPNGGSITTVTSSASGEFTFGDSSTEDGITTYPINPVATVYTWDGGTPSGGWDMVLPWRYNGGTEATRYPVAGDHVIFDSEATVSVSANATVATITNSAAITFAKPSDVEGTMTLTAGEIALTNEIASITLDGVALSSAPFQTLGDDYYVKFADSTYSVDSYKTLVIVPNNSMVTVSTNGTVVVGAGSYKLEAGTVTLTITPNPGCSVTSIAATAGEVTGSGPYTYLVTESATITVTTESMVEDVSFEYYASYTNAVVTATVSEGGDYTLSIGGNEYVATASNGTVTFNDVDVANVSSGDSANYTITHGGNQVANGSAPAKGNVTGTGWMYYAKNDLANVGDWTNGAGSPVTPDYGDNDYVAFSGTNTYTAAWMSTGEVVTVTTSVKFGDVADPEITPDTDAQAAVRIGEGGVFEVYAGPTPSWTSVYNDDLGAPEGDVQYGVTVKLNYTTQAYGVDITKEATTYPLTNATGGAAFQLAKAASAMQQVSYLGAGSFISLSGEYVSAGYTADVGTDGSATNVVVSSDFVSTYMGDVLASYVSEALSPDADPAPNCVNGLNYFSNYALGLNPTVEEEKPVVSVTTDEDGKFKVTLKKANGEEIQPAANVALKVTLKAGLTPGEVTGEGDTDEITANRTDESAIFTIDPTKMSGNVHYYRVLIEIGAQ